MKNWLLTSVFLFSAVTVYAQESPDDLSQLTNLLNTKIAGASRFDQTLHDSNGFANVIDFNHIRQFGFRNTAEALQSFAGNYLSYERDYHYMGVRGLAGRGDFNSRLLLMSDGTRLNDPLYDAALLGNESPVDIDWVKRIEFVSNPGSAQFGPNALLGVANLINFTGTDIQGSQIKYTRLSPQGNKLTLLHGNRLENNNDYLIGFSLYENAGDAFYMRQYDQPENNHGVARNADGERYAKAFVKLSLDQWLLNATLSSRVKVIPTAYWDTRFNDHDNRNRDNSYFINLTHQTALSDKLQGKFKLRAGGYQYVGEFAGPYASNQSESEWYGADYELKYLTPAHQVALGLESQYNRKLKQKQEALGTQQTDDQYLNYSVYIEDHCKLGDLSDIQAGLRFDRINLRTALSPKLTFTQRFNDTTQIKFLYSRAFRPPNRYELFNTAHNWVHQRIDAKQLDNEYITSHEVILQQVTSPQHVLVVNAFQREIHNSIHQRLYDYDYLTFGNGETITTQGLTMESHWLQDNFSLRSNLTWQQSEQQGHNLIHSPKWLAKVLFTRYIPAINVDVSVNLQYNSRSQLSSGLESAAYSVSNLIVSLRETASYGRGSFAIYNLFDKQYDTPVNESIKDGYLAQDGRQFRLYWEYPF